MSISFLVFVGIIFALVAFTRATSGRLDAKFPPSGKFAGISNGRMHYTDTSAIGAERAIVLLLHGASGNEADMRLPLAAPLAERGFRVIAMDRPGLGWSDRPGGRGDSDPRQQTAHIVAAMQAIGVERFIVVAHSLAGIDATALALDHAEHVAGLVLVAPVTHPWPGRDISPYYTIASTPLLGEAFTELIALPAGLALMEQTLAAVFAPQAPPPDYAERTGLARILRPAAFRANAQDVAAAYDAVSRQSPRYGEIKAPTAIVTGNSDGIVLTKVHSFGSARDIPGATLDVLPGVGHSVHWVAPAPVVAAVEEVAGRGRKSE